jgi:hypothetical protein
MSDEFTVAAKIGTGPARLAFPCATMDDVPIRPLSGPNRRPEGSIDARPSRDRMGSGNASGSMFTE